MPARDKSNNLIVTGFIFTNIIFTSKAIDKILSENKLDVKELHLQVLFYQGLTESKNMIIKIDYQNTINE